MDDDIDIEEHDVMDNPRIKSMFPDLACVKIEIPDEEDDVQVIEQYGESTGAESQDMEFPHDYSFEIMTDNVQEDEYEEDNTYFCNNEIILGSKPPVDPDTLYLEALNSNPVVYLENWDEKLKSSPCFCNTCEILFPTVNVLDAHKMISHSYLVVMETPQKNTARKSTSTSKFCNHCSKTFPDDTSLIKHLYELLPQHKFSQERNGESDSLKRKKFTPLLPFPKKIKSATHDISKLPLKNIKLDKEETSDCKPEVKEVKPKFQGLNKDGKFFAASSLVPKSTLFQCNKCQIGFVSCFSAQQHSKYCEKASAFEKCNVCKRKIRSKDAKIHQLQHTYNDKLKIYTINKSIYDRVLCKCPKCLACYDELGFWAHYKKCKKTDKKSVYCSDCEVNIAAVRYQLHRMKHTTKKLTKKDIIIVEFNDRNNIQLITDERMEDMRRQRKKELISKKHDSKFLDRKRDHEVLLYYCDFCGCCQYRLNYKGHSDGSCKDSMSKRYCDKCGLCFSAKGIASHLNLHERRSFSLKDIKIISLTTGKTIEPPMSEFYKCKKCSKHFTHRKYINTHNCKTEKFVTCKVCAEKFNLQAYKIHKLFHKVDKLIPELMKKYNSISTMWDVMFMCVTCDLVTMTYDSAVTHCQGHLNYIISDFHKACVVCDLKIAEKEFFLHEKLHTNNECIARNSFKILKYNYEDLFKKEWLMLFNDLPKQHQLQILSKSIYRYTRSVKMHIEIKGTSDEAKYFCMNCNTFVDGEAIKEHIKSNCNRNNNFMCNICNEVSKSLKQFLTHEATHGNVQKSNTIVTFNNECDREFNNHLTLIETRSKAVITKPEESPSETSGETPTDTKKTYRLYKCLKCDICISLHSSIPKHHCLPDTGKWYCNVCDQYFNARKAPMHKEAHRKKPTINKNSFSIVYFNTESNNKDVTKKIANKREAAIKKDVTPKLIKNITPKAAPKLIAKIYECKCGLHFTSMKSIEKHLDECNSDLNVSKETCSKCQLVFPTEVLVTHLVNHHHKETKIEIEKVTKVNMLKCPHCNLIFTNVINFNSHLESCSPNNGVKCEKCGLMFGRKCFMKHQCSDEENTVINKIVTQKVVKESVVFRCVLCDLSYLNIKTFKYHIDVDHKTIKPPIPCQVCGLHFTNWSYLRHMKVHSPRLEEYRIKIIDPTTNEFVFLTGKNRRTDKEEHSDAIRASCRKRSYNDLSDSEKSVKVVKKKVSDDSKSDRKSLRNIDKASTSKDVDVTYESVSDESGLNTTNLNISDSNISTEMSPNRNKAGISKKLKSRIVLEGYSNALYRCVYCNQHYLKDNSFDYHAKNHKLHKEVFKCDICELDFSRYTLPRHKYVHHDQMGLKREDFIIHTETIYSKKADILARIQKLKANRSSTANISENSELSELNKTREKVSDKDKISFYKCFDCNVCFIDKDMCRRHVSKHQILDPKSYIQCKLCDFQFLIDSLKEHMILHHNTDFRIENLTVYEYKALGEGLDPKLEIYSAVDKVQSRLISTTSDMETVR